MNDNFKKFINLPVPFSAVIFVAILYSSIIISLVYNYNNRIDNKNVIINNLYSKIDSLTRPKITKNEDNTNRYYYRIYFKDNYMYVYDSSVYLGKVGYGEKGGVIKKVIQVR